MSPGRRLARELWSILRDLAPVVVVALLACHLLRSHLLEWYLVPSSSMEPTLHGDPRSGDLVLVDKTAYWSSLPERFDLVVMRGNGSDDLHYVVKRAVAFGDDERSVVRLAEGDLFLGASRQQLPRFVKQPAQARGMRLTHYAFPGAADMALAEYFVPAAVWSVAEGPIPRIDLRAGAPRLADLDALLVGEQARRAARQPPRLDLPGYMATRRPVDTSFLDHAGQRAGSAELYRDIGIELEVFIGPGVDGLQVVFDFGDRFFALSYAASGEVRLALDGVPQASGSGPPLVVGDRLQAAFGYLDGAFFVAVKDQTVFHQLVEVPRGPSPLVPAEADNRLHFAVAGGALIISRLRVFHDVFYAALASPAGGSAAAVEIEPGGVFLLGDNSFESMDSRYGQRFWLADLIGRPLAIIGPRSRQRWLW